MEPELGGEGQEGSFEDPGVVRGFEFTKKELETILERDVLPAAVPEFPTVRRLTVKTALL